MRVALLVEELEERSLGGGWEGEGRGSELRVARFLLRNICCKKLRYATCIRL